MLAAPENWSFFPPYKQYRSFLCNTVISNVKRSKKKEVGNPNKVRILSGLATINYNIAWQAGSYSMMDVIAIASGSLK